MRYGVRKIRSPTRNILLINGRNEWIEKYGDLPESTLFGDTALWVSMDHRGQGASGGIKAHVSSYDDFARDVAAVVKASFKDEPYIIVAHSMGGLIAIYGTMKEILDPEALILSSPLFGMLAPMPIILAKILAHFLSFTPIGNRATGAGGDRRKAFEGNPLTQDEKRFKTLVETEYAAATPTFAWVNASFKATAYIASPKNLKNLKIPVSIMVGEHESVVDKHVYSAWMETWKKASGMKGKFKIIRGAQHELLNEAERFRSKAITFLNQAIKA
ncbi:MAG: alpha/beta hydrolase [Proteobacteria bacterium]|nr:MAG: alpha/beta hydrolase [Pseudomonadota bacterium]